MTSLIFGYPMSFQLPSTLSQRGDHLRPGSASAVDRAQRHDQLCKALEVMGRQEVVDVRHGSLHSDRLRPIVLAAEQRVEPDKPVTAALQRAHFVCQQLDIASIPTVADDDDDCAVS